MERAEPKKSKNFLGSPRIQFFTFFWLKNGINFLFLKNLYQAMRISQIAHQEIKKIFC